MMPPRTKKSIAHPWFIWFLILVLLAVSLPACSRTHNPTSNSLKAAIIDQVYTLYPNQNFTTEVTRELGNYGFQLDIYQGDKVTVDLYRNLPSYGYQFIIFRAHSGSIGPSSQNVESIIGTYLFTNEPYSKIRYPKEQLNDELTRAMVAEGYPVLFAIGPKFITNSMKGTFNNTVIIVDGCSCLYNDDLAQAFAQKGASAYFAWDRTVTLDHADRATIHLVRQLCKKNTTVGEAVANTRAAVGPDPTYNAILKYYPLQNRDRTLKELIQ